jgi:murein DD-endopeptidase MepM/ murein hydrolase activator NlpD
MTALATEPIDLYRSLFNFLTMKKYIYLGLSVALTGGSCAKKRLDPKQSAHASSVYANQIASSRLFVVGQDMQTQYREQLGYKRQAILVDVDFSKAKQLENKQVYYTPFQYGDVSGNLVINNEDYTIYYESYHKTQENLDVVLVHNLEGDLYLGLFLADGKLEKAYRVRYTENNPYNIRLSEDIKNSTFDSWIASQEMMLQQIDVFGNGGLTIPSILPNPCYWCNLSVTDINPNPDPPLDPDNGGGGGGSSPNINQVQPPKPCPRDPVLNPKLAATKAGVKGGRFGWTRIKEDDKTGQKIPKHHYGTDIFAFPDTPLYALYAGTVKSVVNSFQPNEYGLNSFGNTIKVEVLVDGQKYEVLYAHLNEVGVKPGDVISQGQIIGKTGRTGNAAKEKDVPNAHLHLEFTLLSASGQKGERVNPETFLNTKFDEQGNPKPNNNCK